MVRNLSKKLPVLFASFVLFTVVFVVFFGMSHIVAMGMEMRGGGTMGGCLFDGQAEICPMTIAEHIFRWQGMFTAIPQKTDLLVLLFALISAIGAFVVFALKKNRLLLLKYFSDRWRFYLKQNPHIPLFDPLREAFSRGILNPKIYNSATL